MATTAGTKAKFPKTRFPNPLKPPKGKKTSSRDDPNGEPRKHPRATESGPSGRRRRRVLPPTSSVRRVQNSSPSSTAPEIARTCRTRARCAIRRLPSRCPERFPLGYATRRGDSGTRPNATGRRCGRCTAPRGRRGSGSTGARRACCWFVRRRASVSARSPPSTGGWRRGITARGSRSCSCWKGPGDRIRRSRDRIRRRAAARGSFRGRRGTTTSSLAGTSALRWAGARVSRCGWTRSWRGETALGPIPLGTIR
mmetsp:Transcript_2427/g.9139  ORF Transcript_2427/g.9139 Transcript_2427/m.9139 type:complete len:254 (+) Transcript_2427:254-1015(+)